MLYKEREVRDLFGRHLPMLLDPLIYMLQWRRGDTINDGDDSM